MIDKIDDIGFEILTFSWYDYALFTLLLGISVLIGLYFGCTGNKQSTAKEYLFGGKRMTTVPVALSIVACHVSGLTVISGPADIYFYGTTYCLSYISVVLVCVIDYHVYLPVFYNLEITSIYEYIEMRFDRRSRLLASLLNLIAITLYLTVVVYVPALAISQSTNLPVHLITSTISLICIFYTTIGGLKAVIWTDALQFLAMVGAIVAVVFVGMKEAGFVNTFSIAYESGRFDYNFSFSPFIRDTAWSAILGLGVNWLHMMCINQNVIQKFMSLPSMKHAKNAIILFGIGEITIKLFVMLIGLIMVARYYHCDPLQLEIVKKRDGILPYFVIDITRNIPGLCGLFMAGILSASLSTLSACLNSLSGIIYQDFVSPHMPCNIKQKRVSNILKLIVVILGLLVVVLVFVVERLGGLLALSIGIGGATGGPIFGLFTLGLLVPRANAKGAFYGTLTATLVMFWICTGANYQKSQGALIAEHKPLYVDQCERFNFNTTMITPVAMESTAQNDVFFLYKITHYYYSLFGALIVFAVGIPVSFFASRDSKKHVVDKNLLSPVVRWMVRDDNNGSEEVGYYDVDGALKVLNVQDET